MGATPGIDGQRRVRADFPLFVNGPYSPPRAVVVSILEVGIIPGGIITIGNVATACGIEGQTRIHPVVAVGVNNANAPRRAVVIGVIKFMVAPIVIRNVGPAGLVQRERRHLTYVVTIIDGRSYPFILGSPGRPDGDDNP
jgi:hypothetical protein